jgi:23S rRNA (guanosine2251-2'-O)-methyltransferase
MARADGSASQADLVYGFHAVREALAAGARRFQRILVTRVPGDRRRDEILRLARAAHVRVDVQPRPALDRLVPDGRHQGVVGILLAKSYTEPEEILAYARERGEAPLVLVLDEVQDPRNVGAVLRTAEAAGVHGVILPDRRSPGLTPIVAKASAGGVEYLRVARVTNLGRAIQWLQDEKLWVYALDSAETQLYTDLDLRGPIALVLGGEGKGVRSGLLEKCDGRVKIPMLGHVSSLNVSAAAAIVLYEVVRQRSLQRPG